MRAYQIIVVFLAACSTHVVAQRDDRELDDKQEAVSCWILQHQRRYVEKRMRLTIVYYRSRLEQMGIFYMVDRR